MALVLYNPQGLGDWKNSKSSVPEYFKSLRPRGSKRLYSTEVFKRSKTSTNFKPQRLRDIETSQDFKDYRGSSLKGSKAHWLKTAIREFRDVQQKLWYEKYDGGEVW